MKRRFTIIRILRVTFGLFVFSFGEYLSIIANVGLPPWEVLSMGISNHLPFSFGTVHIAIAVIILMIDLLLKEVIGIGTILDAVLCGTFVDLFSAVLPFSNINNKALGFVLLIVSMFVMALGQYFYMDGGLSCGPRDTLLVAIGKRLRKLPIGLVQIFITIALVIVSYFIGGPVGIGTLIAMFGIGTCMQIVFSIFHFDPRSVVQEDLISSIRNLTK